MISVRYINIKEYLAAVPAAPASSLTGRCIGDTWEKFRHLHNFEIDHVINLALNTCVQIPYHYRHKLEAADGNFWQSNKIMTSAPFDKQANHMIKMKGSGALQELENA